MKTFLLWIAVVIGMTVALVFGNAEMRFAMFMLAAFIAVGAGTWLIDTIKKPGFPPCLDCRAGKHCGVCYDEGCRK